MVGNYDESMLSDMLPIYYTRLFPQNIICRWLSCGSAPQPLSNREMSFTLADDVYLRYLSITNQKELQTLLLKKCPHKLDIGAVHNTKPSIGRHDAVVLSRELVFDIDLTDYDEVRTCCQEAKVCDKCWKFMVIACEIIDKSLKEDFGFQSLLWVFSGRRGIHCWVSDYEARTLDSPGRGAVADYLCLITGGDNQNKKVHLGSDYLHSSIKRSLTVIDKYFEELLQDQEFLSTKERLNKFLKMIPDEALRSQVEKVLETMHDSSLERWNTFIRNYESYCREDNRVVKEKYHLCTPNLAKNLAKELVKLRENVINTIDPVPKLYHETKSEIEKFGLDLVTDVPSLSNMQHNLYTLRNQSLGNVNAVRKMKYLVEEIKIQYCYPRLDVNVTKGFNHLLKSPFSIHPKTGKVSIVFRPGNARSMKLEEVPTIYSLLDDSSPENAQHQANMRTAVKNFQEVVFSLEKSEAIRRKIDANTSIDF